MLDTVRLRKELLAEDDTWELWGPMYLFKEENVYQEDKHIYKIHIISYFDKEVVNYKFQPLFTFKTEVM